MSTVKANCPTCGDVDLTTRDVQVMICIDTNQGSYLFRCPSCRLITTKPTEPRVVDVLVAAGCRTVCWQLPAEETHTGQPISYDDIFEFHFALERDDLISQELTALTA